MKKLLLLGSIVSLFAFNNVEVRAAKKVLPRETYLEIWKAARETEGIENA